MRIAGFRRLTLVGLLAAIPALVLASPAASSAAGPRYVTNSSESISTGQVTVQAHCRENEQVSGGGVLSSGVYGDARINGSYPVDAGDGDSVPDDGWGATVDNVSGATVDVTVYAICGSLDLAYREKDLTVGQVVTKIGCPGSRRVVGGGASSAGTFAQATYLDNDYPFDTDSDHDSIPDNAWLVYTQDTLFTGGITGKGYSICAKGAKLRYRQNLGSMVATHTQNHADAACPDATKPVGGGANSGSANVYLTTTAPADLAGGPPPDSWRGAADNTLSFDRSVSSYVICQKH